MIIENEIERRLKRNMEERQEHTKDIIASLNHSKEKMLECISKESTDEKTKKKMMEHLIVIDTVLMTELLGKDRFDLVIEILEEK